MGPFHLSVDAGCGGSDVDVVDSLVDHMPVEAELGAVVRLNLLDLEGQPREAQSMKWTRSSGRALGRSAGSAGVCSRRHRVLVVLLRRLPWVSTGSMSFTSQPGVGGQGAAPRNASQRIAARVWRWEAGGRLISCRSRTRQTPDVLIATGTVPSLSESLRPSGPSISGPRPSATCVSLELAEQLQ